MDITTLINYIKETEKISLIADENLLSQIAMRSPFIFLNCILKVDEKDIPIKLVITSEFPEALPKFLLDKYDTLGFLPHIEPNGSICFLEKESVYINVEEPKAVFQASVELAIKTLSDGLNELNNKDFREEFHVFWERNKYISNLNVISLIDIIDTPKKVQLLKDNRRAILFDLDRNIERQKRIFFKRTPSLTKTGIYVPLLEDCDLTPPKYDQKWSVDEFVNWLKPKISLQNWKILTEEILNKKPERYEYLVLGIPRNTGATILVGVQLKPKKRTNHPLLEEKTGWGLSLLDISRLDMPSILPRGGANVDLQKKKVLLIGCGSVGSHIALMLSKTGLGFLDLVDYDKFKIENIQRFSIGIEHVGKSKVDALKDYLDKNVIGINISANNKNFNDFIKEGNINLSDYDLIVSATGDPTINLSINNKLKKLKVPFIIGWNEPYGIGGHALLSIDDLNGCYRCLFRNRYNVASFASSDQSKPFYKKHLGCGEVYTPYSALDSIRTSELVVRLVNSFLTGKINRPQLISWIGDSKEFLEEGYKLSTRYANQTQDEMNKNRFAFINLECPHCGKINDN
ncbi:MAG: ThiF family adenylyltransferase [Bacteroidota bacterium]